MAIDEQQLGVILQASIDRAKEMLEGAGGFLPFGARAWRDGNVEFLETREGSDEAVDALYQQIAGILGENARQQKILATALVANASLPGGFDDDFETAIAVLVEAKDFCRSIVIPYRVAQGGVELGKMIPEEADPVVFVD